MSLRLLHLSGKMVTLVEPMWTSAIDAVENKCDFILVVPIAIILLLLVQEKYTTSPLQTYYVSNNHHWYILLIKYFQIRCRLLNRGYA